MYYIKLYWKFLKVQLKVMMEYRLDFFIGISSILLLQFTNIFFIKIVFNHIEALNGWTFYEILFIYGIACTGRSLHHIFFDNLWVVGKQYIRTGNLDRLLIRPVNPLFHLVAEKVQQDGLGQLIVGIIVLKLAVSNIGMDWGFWELVLLIIMIISSGMIFVAINLFFSTFSFWMVDSEPLVYAVFSLSDFSRYPLTIYNKGVRFVLTWIIPYGFTAFYPASYFFEDLKYGKVALLTPFIALILCYISYAFWKKGLNSFSSTGS